MADAAHTMTVEPASPAAAPEMISTSAMQTKLEAMGHDLESEGTIPPLLPSEVEEPSDEEAPEDTDEQPKESEEKKPEEKLGRVARAKAKIAAKYEAKLAATAQQMDVLEQRDAQWKIAANYAVEQAKTWQDRARSLEAKLAEFGIAPDARDDEIAGLRAQQRAAELEQQVHASAQERALYKSTAAQVESLKDQYVEEAETLAGKYGVSKVEILRKHVLLAESGFTMEEAAQAVGEAQARRSAKQQVETNARAPRVAPRSTGSTPHVKWSTSTNDMLGFLRSKGHALDL